MEFLDIYNRYKPQLAEVERTLFTVSQSRNAILSQSSIQLLEAGGKRIRPLFALICSKLADGASDGVITLAAAMELVHMATLVHDDVIDDASLRRGQPTVKSQFGNRPAMYTGDFLFAKAISLLSGLRNATVNAKMSEAMVRICEGEIDQIRDFFDISQSYRTYFKRVQRKTALLIEMSCALGALVSGVPSADVRALGRFGRFTGMAFQIIDDVLDFVGDEQVVGKRVGGDLRQGNITLPTLYALGVEPSGKILRELIDKEMPDGNADKAIRVIRDSGGIEFARNIALRYMEKAVSALSPIEGKSAYEELLVVAKFINQRMY